MKSFSDYSSLIEKALQDMELPGGKFEGLYGPIAYNLSAGGKRLRPSLTLMTAEAFGASEESAIAPALGLEVFHNFTLLHDDVMDHSDMRRGRQTVHARWDENTAILSGDTMLTLATQLMTQVPDEILRSVMNLFNEMALRVYEGQRLDMDFENRKEIPLPEYVEMIGLKTGALLSAACQTGALVAGASVKAVNKMGEFGYNLGIAFQIQDDWLDVFGDANTFGKPIGGDINNNKKTYLYVAGMNRADADSVALSEAMTLEAGPTKVKVVTRLYEKMGLSEEAREAVMSYSSKALAALKATGLDETAREPFRKIVEKLTGRRK